MKKIKVPEGMLEVAVDRWIAQFFAEGRSYAETLMQMILEAALLWLTEHPIVPTEEQALSMADSKRSFYGHFKTHEWVRWGASEWQRCMFDEPEPEVPEAVNDLVQKHFGSNPADCVKNLARDCYRRGQKSVISHHS